jgi:hypothetical protein
MNKEFFEALKLLVKEKGIPMESLCEGIEKAIVTAVKKDYNNKDVVFCTIDPESQTLRVFLRLTVVEELTDSDSEILVEKAQNYKAAALPGDIIEIDLETKRSAALPPTAVSMCCVRASARRRICIKAKNCKAVIKRLSPPKCSALSPFRAMWSWSLTALRKRYSKANRCPTSISAKVNLLRCSSSMCAITTKK